jgi:hypothetical protein
VDLKVELTSSARVTIDSASRLPVSTIATVMSFDCVARVVEISRDCVVRFLVISRDVTIQFSLIARDWLSHASATSCDRAASTSVT